MKQKEPEDLSEKEYLDAAKQKRSTNIINAFLIGFVIGVIIYGIAKNNFSFIALIPLFIAYKVLNNPKNK